MAYRNGFVIINPESFSQGYVTASHRKAPSHKYKALLKKDHAYIQRTARSVAMSWYMPKDTYTEVSGVKPIVIISM